MTVLVGLLLTLTIVLASLFGLSLARRWLKTSSIETQHDIADPYSQLIATMFAVLIGFMVADAMQRFADARQTVQQEASSLGDVYRLAEGLPDFQRNKIRALCKCYATGVIQDEWPKMATKTYSPQVLAIYSQLWIACTRYKPVTQSQSNVQQSLLSTMKSVGDNRRMRVEALHSGLPAQLWVVLSLGGLATIVFTYFFGAKNFKIQMVMVGIVSLVICLNLFLLANYNDPFSGDVTVTPSAFETQLKSYEMEK
jgi:hypothetical protein